MADIIEITQARADRVFGGKLDRDKLSFPERAIVFALRAPEGDYRDWEEILRWALEITSSLGLRA